MVAECFQPKPTQGQACKAPYHTVMSSSSAPGQQVAYTGNPPGQSALEANPSFYGCFPDRLGSSLGRQNSEGILRALLRHRTHQSAGAEGSLFGPQGSYCLHTWQACPCKNRQFCHSVQHQPLGGTRSLSCLKVAQRLLTWAFPRLASLKAVYIPGV